MRYLAAILIVVACTAPAEAQSSRVGPPAIEAVAAITNSSDKPDDPFVFLDLAATVPLGNRLDAIVRPWARRLPGGDWHAEMYQLQLRYQSGTRIPVRVDAGIITSPVGLATLELKPDVSPAIKTPFYYHTPLPAFEARRDGVQLMSGGYPIGAIVSVSGARWDARAGITDATPARYRDVFEEGGPPRMRQLVAGGGVSPFTGLRVGAGLAHGGYRQAGTDSYGSAGGTGRAADVTVFNLEAEYAVGYTRFSGEWIRNRFESDLGPAVARGYFVQAVRTLGPRLFATVRLVGASSPAYTGSGRERRSMTTAELSAGYRVHQDLTIRAGYYASRRFGARERQHTAIASVVWAHRWF